MNDESDIDSAIGTPKPIDESLDPGEQPARAPSQRDAQRRFDDPFAQLINHGADDSVADDLWSVPWSDLMMVMFVLFAALLAVRSANPEIEVRYRSQPVPQILEVEKERVVEQKTNQPQPSFDPLLELNVFDRSQDAVLETQLQNINIARLADQSVKISVQGPMFFERGKTDLLPDMREFLDRLARVIAKTPVEIRVIGHTDDNPIRTASFPSNWELSVVRASSVARYLISAEELDPARFVVMGRGRHQPTYVNEDESKRAMNRRVEIIITRDVIADSEEQL